MGPCGRQLNKLGTFSMGQLGGAKKDANKDNIIASFFRNQRRNNDNFEENLLKLVRDLPPRMRLEESQLPVITPCAGGAAEGETVWGGAGVCVLAFEIGWWRERSCVSASKIGWWGDRSCVSAS